MVFQSLSFQLRDQEDDRETNLSRLRTDMFFPTATRLTEFLHEINFQNPENKSAFEFTFGTHLWSYLAQNPSMQKNSMSQILGLLSFNYPSDLK